MKPVGTIIYRVHTFPLVGGLLLFVGSSYYCEAESTTYRIVHPLTGNVKMISFHTGTILPRVDLCVCVVDCVRLERLNVLAVFSTTIVLILAGLNQIKLWYASLSLSLSQPLEVSQLSSTAAPKDCLTLHKSPR